MKTKGIEKIEPWPMCDHMIFAAAGIPAIAITACDIFSLIDTVIHTGSDDMRNVDIDVLDNTVQFLLRCLDSL